MKTFDRILLAAPLQWAKVFAIVGLLVTTTASAAVLGLSSSLDRNSIMAALITAGFFALLFILLVCVMIGIHFLGKCDWFTRFQSAAMREIYEHLTPDEKTELARKGTIAGIWAGSCGVGFALAIGCFVDPLLSQARNVLLVLGAALIAVGVAGGKKWQRRMKEFLRSTQWASAQSRNWDEI